MPTLEPGQRGVALLTVLLVVFLASMAAVNIATMQHIAIRRTTLLQHQQQARLYTLGAEQWAGLVLQRDRQHSANDHLGELWANMPPALALEHGALRGHMRDLHSCFNLNNLWQAPARTTGDSEQPPAPTAHLAPESSADAVDAAAKARAAPQPQLHREQFQMLERLLKLLELEPKLAAALADWIDPDREPLFPDGAEDSDYSVLHPPYLAANQPFVSVSELRLVRGVTAEVYQELAPYVCALPAGTALNVNTAPPLLLAALDADAQLSAVQQVLQQRPAAGYAHADEFLNAAKLYPSAANKALLGVTSQYFQLRVEAQVGEGQARLESILRRDGERVQVLMRSFAYTD